jgi:dihydroorotase
MNGAMMDMPTTMSKFLAMGMPLREVIARSTHMPAENVGRPELGHIGLGAVADLAAWRLDKGSFNFADSAGGTFPGKERLFCELTLKDGRIRWDWNARAGTDYKTLDPDYGIRKGLDFIVLP